MFFIFYFVFFLYLNRSYNLLFLILTYILPLMTMGIAYTLMARVLWGSKQIGESTQAQMNLICSKQKVVRMLICGECAFFDYKNAGLLGAKRGLTFNAAIDRFPFQQFNTYFDVGANVRKQFSLSFLCTIHLVTVLFGCCWLPYHVYFLCTYQ